MSAYQALVIVLNDLYSLSPILKTTQQGRHIKSGSQKNFKSSKEECCSNLRLSTAFGNSERLQMATEDLALLEVKQSTFVMQ